MNFDEIIKKYRIYGLKHFIQAGLKETWYRFYSNLLNNSYAQCGEDLVIDKFFKGKTSGVYIDIGANDPVRFSNTKRFYDKGWTGVNIEPNPYLIEKFLVARPKDKNINMGVALEKSDLLFYIFFPDTLSTFSKVQMEEYKNAGFHLVETRTVPVVPLEELIDNELNGKTIDFISIDTENFDLEVLQSLNLLKNKPSLIMVEGNDKRISDLLEINRYQVHHTTEINKIYVYKKD